MCSEKRTRAGNLRMYNFACDKKGKCTSWHVANDNTQSQEQGQCSKATSVWSMAVMFCHLLQPSNRSMMIISLNHRIATGIRIAC